MGRGDLSVVPAKRRDLNAVSIMSEAVLVAFALPLVATIGICGYGSRRSPGRQRERAVQRAFISTQSNSLPASLVMHRERGRCHGTPPLSEIGCWICRRRHRACCKRRGRAAFAAAAACER